jgi:hypothetical protein
MALTARFCFRSILLMMAGHFCMAQTFSASIAGTVTDSSGAGARRSSEWRFSGVELLFIAGVILA